MATLTVDINDLQPAPALSKLGRASSSMFAGKQARHQREQYAKAVLVQQKQRETESHKL